MSRYTVDLGDNKEFVYGYDHALGYFYELWDNSRDEDLGPLEEKCVIFDRLTRNEMIEKMEKYGSNKEHIQTVSLELPF